jgi:hypothetical protein
LSQAVCKTYTLVAQHIIPGPPEWEAIIDEYRSDDDEQRLVGHIQFFKFSPAIFRQFVTAWLTFRTVVRAPIFVFARTDDEKFARFVRAIGFTQFTDVPCLDGERRRLFIHTTHQDPSRDVQ